MKKFCLVSIVLPPTGSGQGIVLYNLLKDINPLQICLISSQRYFGKGNYYQGKITNRIDCPYYYIPVFPDFFIDKLLKPGYLSEILLKIYLSFRVMAIIIIIWREKCSTVVGCSADLFDPWCSYLAAKFTKKKYLFYSFDDYLKQWNRYPLYVSFAQKAGREILTNADTVIVPNEYLQQQFLSDYGRESLIIRNSIEIRDTDQFPGEIEDFLHDPVIISYTGDIYAAQNQAIINVINAIKEITNYKIVLHIYCGRSEEDLKKQGITGPVIFHESEPYSKMRSIYQGSDILLLPLSFDSPFPSIINSSAPGKMADYLDASKPVLVHAPDESFIAWYFRSHECGYVVSENDVSLVKEAIINLVENQDLRKRLSRSAKNRAFCDFSSEVSRKKFLSQVE